MKIRFIISNHPRSFLNLLTRCFLLCLFAATFINGAMAQPIPKVNITDTYADLPDQSPVDIMPLHSIDGEEVKTYLLAKQVVEKKLSVDKQNILLKLITGQRPLEVGVGIKNASKRKALLTLLDETRQSIYECRIPTGWSLKIFNLRELPVGRYTLKLQSNHSHITRSFMIVAPVKLQTRIVF
jgi:hypothetical protein